MTKTRSYGFVIRGRHVNEFVSYRDDCEYGARLQAEAYAARRHPGVKVVRATHSNYYAVPSMAAVDMGQVF